MVERVRPWTQHLAVRALALVALLVALWALVETGHATLLAWTDRVFPTDRYPALFAALFATWLAGAAARTPRERRIGLLAGSLATGVIFDADFVALTIAWLVPFHALLFSRAKHRVRWATLFVIASYAGLAVVCNRDWFPDLLTEYDDISRWGYVVAVAFTFRIAWLIHQIHVRGSARLPFADVVSYFVFAPFFVIVPYMLAIPRCDRFCAGLDRHDLAVERSGMTMIFLGAALTLAHAWLSQLYDPMTASLDALRTRELGWALVHGLAYYPPQAIVKAVSIATILVGMVRLLGIDLAPSMLRPELSRSITEWWRRWNVHFRELLVDLFYYPIVMRYRRTPVKATVLGCAAVFLVGSVVFHWPKTYFTAGSFRALPMGTAAEDVMMFVIVTVALLREQRRPRAVVLRPWFGILSTWFLVFTSVAVVGYGVNAWWRGYV